MTFTKDCLNEVSLNTLVHFVQNFPHDLFDLDVHLDWVKFYDEANNNDRIKWSNDSGKKNAKSALGIPLINHCIINESSSPNWPLKKMLNIILESGHF